MKDAAIANSGDTSATGSHLTEKNAVIAETRGAHAMKSDAALPMQRAYYEDEFQPPLCVFQG